jgi:hypothetical protein
LQYRFCVAPASSCIDYLILYSATRELAAFWYMSDAPVVSYLRLESFESKYFAP